MKKKSTPKKNWDLLGDDSYASRVKEAMMTFTKGSPIGDISSYRHNMLPIPEFGLQLAFNTFGFLHGSVVDIIAPDGIGKTTLLFTLAGYSIAQGSPFFYEETENKMMAPDRIKRCLSSDPVLAEKYYNRIIGTQVFDIQTAILNIENFAIQSRDPNSPIFVPKSIPICFGMDTFSKLLDKGEAEGVMVYGDEQAEAKEVGGGSNFGAAKMAHAWFRRLPFFLNHYNMIGFFTRHQNDKIDMSGFGGGMMKTADNYNRTSRGGRAFNQNAALQMILSRLGGTTAKIGGETEKVGVQGQITVCKNSYGPERKIKYLINTVHRTDSATFQEQAITFGPGTADYLFMKKILPISRKNQNCYTCKDLDVYDVSAEDLVKALHSQPALMERLGGELGIYGYKPSEAPPRAVAAVEGGEETVETVPEDDQDK